MVTSQFNRNNISFNDFYNYVMSSIRYITGQNKNVKKKKVNQLYLRGLTVSDAVSSLI